MAYYQSNQWVHKLTAMADPLPPPDKDIPQRPNPNVPPSSPYLPGKSPHKLDLAHYTEERHEHPGGKGFIDDPRTTGQDLIINDSDSTEDVYFNTPVQDGGYIENHPMLTPQFGPNDDEPWLQATHDKPLFKSVPASGVRGDHPAGEIKDFLLRKDENLMETQMRLKGV